VDQIAMTFTIPGTLAANHTFTFKAQRPLQILGVSAVNTSANAGTIAVGTAADADGFLVAKSFGVSGAPAEYEKKQFDGALLSNPGNEYPAVEDGDVVSVTITDHASHMANVCVVLFCAA